MRSKEAILEELTYKRMFQGRPCEKAILETLLDIREIVSTNTGKKSVVVSGFKDPV